MTDEGYLSPRPADYDVDPLQKHQILQVRHDPPNGPTGHKQRFDSGVADLEMHRMSIDSARPRSAAMYEYIDSASHYEDIPSHMIGKSVSQQTNGSTQGRRSIVSDSRSVLTDVTLDTDDTATIFKTPIDKKRKYNPLYEPTKEATPSSFARKQTQKQMDSLERHIRVQCCLLIVISIFAIAALSLSLYLLIFQVFDHNIKVLHKIEILEESRRNIVDENEKLKIIVTAAGFNTSLLESPLLNTLRNTSEAVLAFEDQLNDLSNNIAFTRTNLSQEMTVMESSFMSQLLNISKMPGPPGPPGVGNLSACRYSKHTTQSPSADTEFATQFWPQIDVLKTKVVMFAACSVQFATQYSLDTNAISPSEVQYKCKCAGKIDDNTRKCELHLFMCPRES